MADTATEARCTAARRIGSGLGGRRVVKRSGRGRTAQDGSALLPCRDRSGAITGWARVDLSDALWLAHISWYLDPDGYVRGGPRSGATYVMHRLLLGLATGDPREGDHVNGDRADNRRSNLRVCTRKQNGQNVIARPGAVSRYRGVTYQSDGGRRKRWRAQVVLAGRKHHLGYFETEDLAAEAAAGFREQHMPFTNEARNGH